MSVYLKLGFIGFYLFLGACNDSATIANRRGSRASSVGENYEADNKVEQQEDSVGDFDLESVENEEIGEDIPVEGIQGDKPASTSTYEEDIRELVSKVQKIDSRLKIAKSKVKITNGLLALKNTATQIGREEYMKKGYQIFKSKAGRVKYGGKSLADKIKGYLGDVYDNHFAQ